LDAAQVRVVFRQLRNDLAVEEIRLVGVALPIRVKHARIHLIIVALYVQNLLFMLLINHSAQRLSSDKLMPLYLNCRCNDNTAKLDIRNNKDF